MSEKKVNLQVDGTERLLSIANLEQTDSGRKVIAWFFETPQVFEFSLDSEKALQIFNLLEEAKKKQLPVNVYSTSIQDKNIINRVMPATAEQIHSYNLEKAQRQEPLKIPPPAKQ